MKPEYREDVRALLLCVYELLRSREWTDAAPALEYVAWFHPLYWLRYEATWLAGVICIDLESIRGRRAQLRALEKTIQSLEEDL